MLKLPPNGDPYLTEMVAVLNAELLRKEPLVLGWKRNGTNADLRFRAPLDVPWIQVHVQSAASGEGGIKTYDAANYKSTTEVDCRTTREQDVTIGANGGRYAVFLSPAQYDGAGVKVLYDGQGGRPDYTAFAQLGSVVFDAREFGVVAGVGNDNQAALQAAIDAASAVGAKVVLPAIDGEPTIYEISGRLVAKSNCVIEGSDKYLVSISLPQSNIATMDYSMFENTANLTNFAIRHLGLRGNRTFQTTNITNGGTDGYAVGFFTGTITNVEFEDLYVRDFGATGAAENSGGGGILIVPTGTDTTCTDIRCVNSVFGINNKVPGFYLDPQNGSTTGGGRNITVVGNTFAGGGNNNCVYVLGGYGAASAKNVKNVRISGNTFHLIDDCDSCVEVNGVLGFTIDHNLFHFTSTGVAQVCLIRSDCQGGTFDHNVIRSENTDTTKPVVNLLAFNNGEYQDDITISDNTWYFDNVAVVTPIKVLKGSRRVRIHSNHIRGGTTSLGVAVDLGECTDVDVYDNTFENCAGASVIRLATGTNPVPARIRIYGNKFYDCGGSGKHMIATTGGTFALTELLIYDNVVLSPKSTAGGARFVSTGLSAATGNYLGRNFLFGGLLATDVTSKFASFDETVVTTLANDATPSVVGGHLFKTGGTTTITDFDEGYVGQEIAILSAHSLTITDGAPIILAGGANFAMVATDTLTLRMFDDQVWHEVSRSVN